jgi:nucleotide-binding universal stress UspA family protein
MYRFKKLLVAVNFNETDDSVLAYARHVSRLAKSERIYFAHTAENLEIPQDIRDAYPALIEPVDEFAVKRMQDLADNYFAGNDDTELFFEVLEGDQISNLLRQIKIKDIDLVLVGKSASAAEDHMFGEKLARKAPCSVLIIPEGTAPVYKNITVACDFSDHSLNALDVGRAFSSSAGLDTFTCLHVYNIPTGYYKTGKTYEEFSEVMKNNANQQFDVVMKKMNMNGYHPELNLMLDSKPARAIDKHIEQSETDLLILGARGRANGAGVLLGSVTERLIQTVDIPVLAVKKKGTGMDILEALLNR